MNKYKKVIQNNKLSAPTWNKEFKLSDRSYSASNIQDYFEYILIYINKIENRITFKIKTGYFISNF